MKPFIYAHALDRGTITPGSVLYDLPAFADGFGNIDGHFLGPMLPRRALANSRNVPATWLVGATGLDETYDFLGRRGQCGRAGPGGAAASGWGAARAGRSELSAAAGVSGVPGACLYGDALEWAV